MQVTCSSCATVFDGHADGKADSCPHCGQAVSVSLKNDSSSAATVEVRSAPARFDADVSDSDLVADLREAMGTSPGLSVGLGEDGSDGPGRSSEAPSRRSAPPTLPVGSRLDDYEILTELGRGGMGIVYRARQVSLGREVALKVLPSFAHMGRTGVERFHIEAQAAARLHHTNVVSIYAQGEHEGNYYYAMELVEGVSLDTVIHSRPDLLSSAASGVPTIGRPSTSVSESNDLTLSNPAPGTPLRRQTPPAPGGRLTLAAYRHVAALVAEVADGLEHAHTHGVIHRDVKPHNLLLGRDNRLYLTDFGVARLTDQPHLTVSGEVMGTPAYLSPEQISGHLAGIDHRTDIYSLGVTLYELITRAKPFSGETRDQILTAIREAEPAAPRRLEASVPRDLETVCLRAMEKDPQRRHASAAVLGEDLRRFAEGRPILSRRIGPWGKAVKWVRRHKALSTAIAAAAAVVVLAGGLAWNVSSARRSEANRLLDGAYEQLAYHDYKQPGLVTEDIDRARSLGADPDRVLMVQALAHIGPSENSQAIDKLEAVVAVDPSDQRALYLLSFAQWCDNRRTTARQTYADAEELGDPQTADAWFFRGLAVHFADPKEAIKSYRQATALRAADRGFYPQAVLHLARAQNQRLYARRQLEAFADAEAALKQLIDQGHYDAYPHYLLSISHRLAAEIYRGSTGTRDDSLVTEHYDAAMYWARLGQEKDPTDDRPITAEAECLESRGQFSDALEARRRAIEVARDDLKVWEGYHYSWRLEYWLGNAEAALEDLAACRQFDEQNIFYIHVYPALVQAEMGDLESALEHARILGTQGATGEDEPPGAQAVLWSATCLLLLGQADEADVLLADRAEAVDYAAGLTGAQTEEWVRALYAFCRDDGPIESLEALAEQADQPWRLWGEAYFHAAARLLAAGDREGAQAAWQRAYRSFDSERRYTFHAKLILTKLRENPSWPTWIPVSWEMPAEGAADRENGVEQAAPDAAGGTGQ
ncbi:MAG: protein kinase [bacterium]|nr:protein kinase [bacterium]